MEHPAYLLIGSSQSVEAKTDALLKEAFCSQKGCDTCTNCVQINERRHHGVRWLVPEAQFKVDQLAVIFDTICYALDEGQKFFFVIERADVLGGAAANSLLKSLEEPPAGYHFILHAPWQEGVLSTILSRCITITCDVKNEKQHALMKFFTQWQPTMHEFAKELDKAKPNDKEAFDVFDMVYHHFAQLYKQSCISEKDSQAYQRIIDRLDLLRKYPPMPGSGKMFLRNLFLQCFY